MRSPDRAPAVIAAIVAGWMILLALVSLAAFSAEVPSAWDDANLRSSISTDVLQLADKMKSDGASPPTIARSIVDRVRSVPGLSVAVVDDSGKLLAGSAALAQAEPQPVNRRIGPQTQGDRPPGVRVLYALHAQGDQRGWLFGLPLRSMPVPAVVVRTPDVRVIMVDDLGAVLRIQNEYRVAVLVLVALAVGTLWFAARQTLMGGYASANAIKSALSRLAKGDCSRLQHVADSGNLSLSLVSTYNAAAQRLELANQQRAEAEAKIRQFVADAGHELRTPLTVVMGFVDVLRHGVVADQPLAARIFNSIEAEGERMKALISKLLLLTRLDSAESHDVQVLDAAEVASDVVESFKAIADGASLTLHAQPESFIRASKSELREAIANVVENALKYASGAAIDTSVRTTDGTAAIEIADDGPGMSAEVRAKAFERFARGGIGGSVPGSGLGLAIVKRAVERAGGTVALDTDLGRGTRVVMRFPLASGPQPASHSE